MSPDIRKLSRDIHIFLNKLGFLLLLSVLTSSPIQASTCKEWESAKKIGDLDKKQIPESSGLKASRQVPGRLYHVNDSGNGPSFQITNLKGQNTQTVKILNYKPRDPEALAYGKCLSEKHCVYIGDIGDNFARRKNIEILALEEHTAKFPNQIKAAYSIKAVYPEQARDAEAMSLHPSGNMYIVSKEFSWGIFTESARAAHIYRLKNAAQPQDGICVLEYLGDLNLPQILSEYDAGGQAVTDMDISSDGKKFVLLTYSTALEFDFDLETLPAQKTSIGIKKELKLPHKIIPIKSLYQQEAITFADDDRSIIYSSEANREGAPLYQTTCRSATNLLKKP